MAIEDNSRPAYEKSESIEDLKKMAKKYLGLPPNIYNAVNEVKEKTQAPMDLVISSVMGAASLACQSQIDVISPYGARHPCSLFFLTIAESGERKTTVDRLFTSPIFSFEKDGDKEYQKNKIEYQSKMEAWKEIHKNIIKKIRDLNQEGESTITTQNELLAHNQKKPEPPKRIKLIYGDATPEAIAQGLWMNWPSASIMSDEAGSILNGRAMNDLALLNQLWDGNDFSVDRKNSESFFVQGARLTVSLMTQEKSFEKFVSRQEGIARGIGFLARCFVAKPVSTQGKRLYTEISSGSSPALDDFHEKIKYILNENSISSLPTNETRVTYKLSYEALGYWMWFFNEFEKTIDTDGIYSGIKDAVSKLGENCLRVAAIFHHFDLDKSKEIKLKWLIFAIEFCRKYLENFNELFGNFGCFSKDYKKLNEMINFLRGKKANAFGSDTEIEKNKLLQWGPIRNSLELNKILQYMIQKEGIITWPGARKQVICINLDHPWFKV